MGTPGTSLALHICNHLRNFLIKWHEKNAQHVTCEQVALELAPSSREKVPLGQNLHTVTTFAPMTTENVPGGHRIHDETPLSPEYVPSGHSWHTALVLDPITVE